MRFVFLLVPIMLLGSTTLAQESQVIPATPAPLSPHEYPELWKKIAQRDDPELRERTLDEVYEMLTSKNALQRRDAMVALAETTATPFDRSRFEPLVLKALDDQEPTSRLLALQILRRFGGTIHNLPKVASLADDDNYFVRAGVAHALYQLDPKGESSVTEETLLKLLSDESSEVVRETCRSLWGRPTTHVVDARLIELTSQPNEHRAEVLHLALSTRPLMTEPVAAQLIELANDEDIPPALRERAVWGISHNGYTKEAKRMAVDAMIYWARESARPGIRRDAVWGLARIEDERVQPVIRKALEDEDADVRREARRALKRLGLES